MSEDLDAVYERTLFQLYWLSPGTAISNGRLIYSILLFLASSGRSVTVAEVAKFAIVEEVGEDVEPDNRFEDLMSILPLLGNLVNVQDFILSLSHKSIKDFLESPRARRGSLQMGLF